MKYRFLLLFGFIGTVTFAQTVSRKVEPTPVNKTTFNYVEQMPEPGFDVADYIRKNLIYPRKAKRKNIQGRVVVQFIVNTDGTVDSVHAINKKVLGYGLEEAAVDLVKNMPRWQKSGRQNGKLVKVFYSQPVIFKLTD